MLKHSINLTLFVLLAGFATPSAAEQVKAESIRADNCGYACIFTDSK
jgi:hypothetical protein